jgi:hypothetical protein
VTLSFSPLSLSEVHRRRCARAEECVELPEVELLDVALTDEAEAN